MIQCYHPVRYFGIFSVKTARNQSTFRVRTEVCLTAYHKDDRQMCAKAQVILLSHQIKLRFWSGLGEVVNLRYLSTLLQYYYSTVCKIDILAFLV